MNGFAPTPEEQRSSEFFSSVIKNHQESILLYDKRIQELKAALLEIYEIATSDDNHDMWFSEIAEKVAAIADRAINHTEVHKQNGGAS